MWYWKRTKECKWNKSVRNHPGRVMTQFQTATVFLPAATLTITFNATEIWHMERIFTVAGVGKPSRISQSKFMLHRFPLNLIIHKISVYRPKKKHLRIPGKTLHKISQVSITWILLNESTTRSFFWGPLGKLCLCLNKKTPAVVRRRRKIALFTESLYKNVLVVLKTTKKNKEMKRMVIKINDLRVNKPSNKRFNIVKQQTNIKQTVDDEYAE